MNKERQRGHGAKDKPAATGDRTGKSNCPVIVVGIGVSTGGLNSLKQLFAKMPSGHGVAFVLIQHLESGHENLSVKLLKDLTALTVVRAADGMEVLPDRIHVMPADRFLNITESRLSFQGPVQCDGLRMPIDHFFCSLAADQRRRGCGIVLSGIGSDGTLGLSEIKVAGGRTLVEYPGSGEFPDMPQSAIDVGIVDAVLPADAMAEAIVALAEQVARDTAGERAESPEFDASLRAVLDILRAKVGHDFRCYKPNTLVRRIRRRMTLGKVATFADYGRFLLGHPEEVGLLQKDLLIGVTEFFRQPQAWEILEEKVIIPLVEEAKPGSEIRVWVPGCSTGREAYGLAMLLVEQVEKPGKKVAIQIFATDSDVAALATARNGSYSKEEIGENVSPERLKRFFSRKEGRWQILKKVRDQVVFAPQNITADPPFSRLDLISCRNLLIYLDQEVQKKIIALFHFALREGGFLFLGTAETVGDREDLFEPVSKKWRIYRRIGVGRPVGVEIPVRPTGEARPAPSKFTVVPSTPRVSLTSAAQQMLLDRFAPACVMSDRKLQVLYVHGPVENYLTFPAGELTTRVVDMAREGLQARLRGAIAKCLEVNRSVSVTTRVRRGEKSVPVKATVSPLRYPREADGLLLITFEDYRVSTAESLRKSTRESGVQQLQDELKVTREELQSTIEQLESSNDQLKASNEEVTAANEELQSANEELETSKEELQSLNEELNTINARLQEKVDELEDTNNDVVNLLSSTSIATVFLDKELKVRRYTPTSTRLLSLIPSDVGRPIADVLCRFSDEALLEDAARVLADLTPLAKEVQAEDGRWYIRRITPYRTQDDRIEGVVITFVDIADLKQTEQALGEAHERAAWLARFPEENPNPVLRVSAEGSVLYCNPASVGLPGWACEVGKPPADPLLPLVGRAMMEGREVQQDVELAGRSYFIAVTPFLEERYANVYGRDITDRKRAEEALRQLNAELEERLAEQTAEIRRTYEAVEAERQRLYDVLETLPVYVVLLSKDYHVPFANRFFRERFGESHGRCCFNYLFGRTEPCENCETYKVLKINAPHHWEWTGPDGRNYDIYDFPFTDTDGSPLIMEMGIDITERKKAEEALREAHNTLELRVEERTLELQQLTETLEQRVQERTAELAKSNEMLQSEMAERLRLVAAVEQAGEGIVITDPEGIIHYVNPAFEQMGGCRREEVLGTNYYEVLAGEDLKKEIQDVLRGGEAWSGRFNRKGRSGQSFELDVTFSPIRDRSGTVINYLAVERDVTQEARLEQHLRQMQKMEALGTLAGGIAHDFNNILNPIFINTELVLLDTPPGSPTRELMELSLKAAERGRELVKQIITFSRQKEKERKPTKAGPLIKEALKFLRASLPSTVEIQENIPGETGYILADPTQIHQVVMNLCSNAAHAMREQGGVMELSLAEVEVDVEMALRHPDLKSGPYLRLTVTDTGTGMTPEVMERAFDPFFTTKKPGEGSGMGLAVVHGIVRNHEGAITVYSEVGRGSTFSVYLPEIEGGEKVETVTTGPIPGGKERILLVDDEEIQIRTIQPALERLGYRVIAGTDSREALEVFRVRPDGFDLVITDQTMPHMTGLRLAEEILRIRPDVPIILCTGFSESVNGERIKGAGIREYIMKPFSARDLAQTIRRALAREK